MSCITGFRLSWGRANLWQSDVSRFIDALAKCLVSSWLCMRRAHTGPERLVDCPAIAGAVVAERALREIASAVALVQAPPLDLCGVLHKKGARNRKGCAVLEHCASKRPCQWHACCFHETWRRREVLECASQVNVCAIVGNGRWPPNMRQVACRSEPMLTALSP